jgi:hypothetical protein
MLSIPVNPIKNGKKGCFEAFLTTYNLVTFNAKLRRKVQFEA